MNKKLFAVLLAFVAAAAGALDLNIRPRGFALIPLGAGNESDSGDTRYNVGGGGELGFEADLSSVWANPLGLGYTIGAEGGYFMTPHANEDYGAIQTMAGGGVIGLNWFPLSRLFTRIDGAVGGYQSFAEEGKNPPGLYWRAGLDAGFRFAPAFTLAASAGWRQYESASGKDRPANSGLYAGLTAQVTIEVGAQRTGDGAAAAFAQDGEIYPVFLSLYQSASVGTITVRNSENAEIRDVRVSFRAAGYTASEYPCGTVPLIPKGRASTVPLYADFSQAVLNFTDNGRIIGEIVIRYRFLGKEEESVSPATVAVLHRNSFPAGDSAGLAAFVSPTSPEVLEFAKNVVGLARTQRRTGLNQNMQFALWLYEALNSLDGTITVRSADVQFPAQTLAYQTGTARDWGLLYAGCLEAAGINAAYIQLPDGGFIAAMNLGINEAAAATLFNGTDKLLVINDDVWLPLSAGALFSGGFNAAWDEAAKLLAESTAELNFITLAGAWAEYPPAPFPALNVRIEQPEPEALAAAANASIDGYVTSDIEPLIANIQAELKTAPTAALYNRLGVMNIRAGDTKAAKAAFQRGADMGSESAKRNLENLK